MNPHFLLTSLVGITAMAFVSSAVAAKPETRNRAEIPAQYKWDFASQLG